MCCLPQCTKCRHPEKRSFTARWLAYALLYRRFADALAGAYARLEVDAVRYSFIVRDSHPLLLAGLPAHAQKTLFVASVVH